MIRQLLTQLQHRVLPHICILCGERTQNTMDLCVVCKKDLPWLQQSCLQCAIPLYTEATHCGKCLKSNLPYTKTIALFHYQTPIIKLITALKFQHRLIYARVLGELLAEKIIKTYGLQPLPECIIPIPLHSERLCERGFNQALELARPLEKHLNIPINLNACQRIINTQAQSLIPAKNRQHNIKNAFIVNESFSNKHIAIIDDVMTTGSTVYELSKILKKARAKQIDIWCCARTSF
jgi:ComF family protein